MSQMLKLANNIKAAIATMLQYNKTNTFMLNGQVRNLSTNIENVKKNQFEILELKNKFLNNKSLFVLNRRLEIAVVVSVNLMIV